MNASRRLAAALGGLLFVLFAGPACDDPFVAGGSPTSQPAAAPAAQAPPQHLEPMDLIPARAMATWQGRPLREKGSGAPDAIITAASAAANIFKTMGDPETRLAAALFIGFGEVIRHPFALAVLDAKAEPTTNDKRVDDLKLILVVDTEGDSLPFRQLVQQIVNTTTGSETAKLETREAGAFSFQDLYDSRLPKWSRVGWGDIEQHFVVTLGDDVWPEVAAVAAGETESVSDQAWVVDARSDDGAAAGHQAALVEIVADQRRIRERLDPFLDGRATRFFEEWDARDIDRARWALGFEGRAMFCEAQFLRGGELTRRLYADPSVRDPKLLATVPEGANYAMYQFDAGEKLSQFVSSIVATRDPKTRDGIMTWWAAAQERGAFDADRDILSQLGNRIVLHNFPRHPLGLPLAVTTLYEIDGDPQRVRNAVDALCSEWAVFLEKDADERGVVSPGEVVMEDDGVWYAQIGAVMMLSWTVTDEFLVTSYSPKALREYLDAIDGAAGTVLLSQPAPAEH